MLTDESKTGKRLRESFLPILNSENIKWGSRKIDSMDFDLNIAGILSIYRPKYGMADINGFAHSVFQVGKNMYTERATTFLNTHLCKLYEQAVEKGLTVVEQRLRLVITITIIHELGHVLFDRDSSQEHTPRSLSVPFVLYGDDDPDPNGVGEAGEAVEYALCQGIVQFDNPAIKEINVEDESTTKLLCLQYKLVDKQDGSGKKTVVKSLYNMCKIYFYF